MTTHIYSLSSNNLTISDFSLKALVRSFLIHCEFHNVNADEYTYTVFKAGHEEGKAWKEKHDTVVWVDPVEGYDVIFEVLDNV